MLVTLERRTDGVAVIQLNHPPANALSQSLVRELESVAVALAQSPPGAVIVTGSDRVFAAGADINEFSAIVSVREFVTAIGRAFDAIAAIPRMVIAAVDGYALGGGCELALACDLRVAGRKAKFGQPEIALGIIPGAGATQRLPRLVGPARAKDLILTGRTIGAAEAHQMGLVDLVANDGQSALDCALELAARLASGPVLAQAIAKRVIDAGLDTDLAAGLVLEVDGMEEAFATNDAKAGIASFLTVGPGKAVFSGT